MVLQPKVIEFIKRQYKDRFRVIDNTGEDKKVIAGQFPDIIFMQKEPPPNDNILFTLKIEEPNEKLLDRIPEWKALGSAPSVLYVVVEKSRLDEAKKLSSATGVRARFAWYEIDDDNVKQVHYE